MKYTILILLLLLFVGCGQNSTTAKGENGSQYDSLKNSHEDNGYPKEVVQLGIEHLFDKAKWILYCGQSYHKLDFIDFKDRPITYGELQLKFDNLKVRGDTTEINFFFYFNNQRVDGKLVDHIPAWGCVFLNNSEAVYQISGRHHVRYYYYKCPDTSNCLDYKGKLTDQRVITYIKEYSDNINPWFRNEAVKRGVLKQ